MISFDVTAVSASVDLDITKMVTHELSENNIRNKPGEQKQSAFTYTFWIPQWGVNKQKE